MLYQSFVNLPQNSPISGWLPAGGMAIIVILGIWDLVWKGLGMWKAAQKKESVWFVALFIINTVGILPILYLYVFSKNDKKSA